MDCRGLLAIKDADVIYSTGTTYLSVAEVTCHSGYQLNVSPFLVCQANGNWDGFTKECQSTYVHMCFLRSFAPYILYMSSECITIHMYVQYDMILVVHVYMCTCGYQAYVCTCMCTSKSHVVLYMCTCGYCIFRGSHNACHDMLYICTVHTTNLGTYVYSRVHVTLL